MIGAVAVRWVWEGRGLGARLVRAVLVPPAAVYGAVMRLRAAAYRVGLLRTHTLPLPAIAVGNLSVGGTGKTPLAAWLAGACQERGVKPAVLLRGYGTDETLVHERLTPGAIVIASPDRRRAAAQAAAQGAGVALLDDAFQRLDVARDANVALISTEHHRAAPWPLPAGPWREGWDALGRATLIVVTRKRATPAQARALAAELAARWPDRPVEIAHLALDRLETLRGGTPVPLDALAGRRIVAAAGIADPASFAVQLRALGATVQLLGFQDHHRYDAADVQALVQAAAGVDYLIVTEKDAVKLRHQWPRDAREPLVALLEVHWDTDASAVRAVLDRVLAPAGPPRP